jgi:exopolyphosphatase/guanosine-5'-triphosphate,3'-diphosphate pyrophosphatase
MGMVPCDALLRRPAALLMFQAKKQFQLGPSGPRKDSLYE